MRILITGASGAGTTTLGKAVASKMNWSFIDTDDYYWLPTKPQYQEKRDHFSRLFINNSPASRNKIMGIVTIFELDQFKARCPSGKYVNCIL
jgi:adenylate kinase family enzyme